MKASATAIRGALVGCVWQYSEITWPLRTRIEACEYAAGLEDFEELIHCSICRAVQRHASVLSRRDEVAAFYILRFLLELGLRLRSVGD